MDAAHYMAQPEHLSRLAGQAPKSRWRPRVGEDNFALINVWLPLRVSSCIRHLIGRPSEVPPRRPAREAHLDFDQLEAELSMLLTQMENQPEDRFELFLMLQEKLNEMRAFGMPVPEDLQRLEQQLAKEFTGRKR